MKQQTINALRNLIERLGAFTIVVADALPDHPDVQSVSQEVVQLADDATDALAKETVD